MSGAHDAAMRPPPGPIPGRLGILGGTFDPVHIGHLALAEEARGTLGLERVLFVVAGEPWQKADHDLAPAELRLAMVEAAIHDNPEFGVSRIEVDRPGPTYTVDTLEAIAAEARARGEVPDLWFLLSADALGGLRSWRDPDRILDLACLAVAPRMAPAGPATDALTAADGALGRAGESPLSRSAAAARFAIDFPGREGRVVFLDGPRLAISSTEIRARMAAGRSIRYLVPDRVVGLIREYALYRPNAAPAPVPTSD